MMMLSHALTTATLVVILYTPGTIFPVPSPAWGYISHKKFSEGKQVRMSLADEQLVQISMATLINCNN